MKAFLSKNNQLIADKVSIADNFFSRSIGLLNKTHLNNGEALLIKPCNSIHCIGMKFSIDVIFLDKNNKIVCLIKKMKPFSISNIVFSSNKVLELKEGTIEKFDIKLDDVITFQD